MGDVPELDARVLELPYTDEDYRMLVFLPNSEEPNAVRDLDRKISRTPSTVVDRNLNYGRVIVEMPRFKQCTSATPSHPITVCFFMLIQFLLKQK